MKRILSTILAVLMVVSAVAFTACSKTEPVKFGMGVYVYNKTASSADGDVNGNGETVATVAAVLVDANGKIVKCELDTVDCVLEYTSNGEAVEIAGFKTKYELGNDYNMVAYGGATKEWFEQADAFEGVCIGKTAEEVKALFAENGYSGNDEVVAAGCTIAVSDFVYAVEKAVANAAESNATANDTLSLGVIASVSTLNASADANGYVELDLNVAAAVKNADNKVVVCDVDVAQASFSFDTKGAMIGELNKTVTTKNELGTAYGMVAYGGATKEWFEQANALEGLCVGKTADEISALVVNGYGVEEVQTAGCTIAISDMVAAVVKAAK